MTQTETTFLNNSAKYDCYIVDTNVLLRYLMRDDELQFAMVQPYFTNESYQLILPIHAICETVWFLRSRLKIPHKTIMQLLENLVNQSNVNVDRNSFNFGMAFMNQGGDFADGVIAHHVQDYPDGCLLTFDKKALAVSRKLNLACVEPS